MVVRFLLTFGLPSMQDMRLNVVMRYKAHVDKFVRTAFARELENARDHDVDNNDNNVELKHVNRQINTLVALFLNANPQSLSLARDMVINGTPCPARGCDKRIRRLDTPYLQFYALHGPRFTHPYLTPAQLGRAVAMTELDGKAGSLTAWLKSMVYMSRMVTYYVDTYRLQHTKILHVVPLTTSLIPNHCQFDTRCLGVTLGFTKREDQLDKNKVWKSAFKVFDPNWRYGGALGGFVFDHMIKTDGVSLCISFRSRESHELNVAKKLKRAVCATEAARRKREIRINQPVEDVVTGEEVEDEEGHKVKHDGGGGGNSKKKRELKYVDEFEMDYLDRQYKAYADPNVSGSLLSIVTEDYDTKDSSADKKANSFEYRGRWRRHELGTARRHQRSTRMKRRNGMFVKYEQ